MSIDGVELEFEDDALKEMAHTAIERKTGARGLRSIMEDTMRDIMYEVPSDKDVKKVIVTADSVLKKSEPKIVKEAQ